MSTEREVLLSVKGMSKKFGSTVALNNVDISIYKGEIRGLIGENGSGKSTISSIISGIQKADSGQILFKSQEYSPRNMMHALESGVGMIVQEKGTISDIPISENIFLGKMDQFKKIGLIQKNKLYAATEQVLNRVGMEHVRPDSMTWELDQQDQKFIEVAKVMMMDPDLLIVDETTTALSQSGRDFMYELMNKLKLQGKSILFISHDLDELMQVCDTLTVLRDGNLIRNLEKEEFEEDLIKQLMVGREISGNYYRSDYDNVALDDVVLDVKGIQYQDKVHRVSFQLHKGEILGIGGLSHCGMHELGKCLFAFYKTDEGEVIHNLSGDPITSTKIAMQHKLGYISKDRDHEALVLSASVKDNIAIAGVELNASKKVLIKNSTEKSYVQTQIDQLSIKCSSMDQNVQFLSGGNKQKVVFGKWIGRGSEILIMDCPTRGVDIGIKKAMYELMYEMKQQGKSIIMISEELPELIGMSDRIMIMKNGKVDQSFVRNADLNESDLIHYMI
ncbi:sugar ABC transporter ATP-binding protein [Paenibacillus sp. FSL R10-2734]|uniref:sugar ABC transporter ATP-binding protein n=1 Tax=Paenibacillus sp. FSL R10-2734 TaxID=2954691 RepID=UPI0030D907FD